MDKGEWNWFLNGDLLKQRRKNNMKTMITGVQPSGNFTLGNYLGAIKNFVKLQKDYQSYIFIADLHGLTSYQEPTDIKKRILDLAAIYFDEEKKPGISNLISIYCAVTNQTIKEVEERFKTSNYSEFKKAVADEVEKVILSIQKKFQCYRYSEELFKILSNGADNAREYAEKKLIEVRTKLGIKYN